jgi:CBS domain-containing protein
MSDRVRDAMLSEPRTLSASASVQEAGELLARPEVRVVFVCDDGRLVGAVTRATLVREIVAAGRDAATPVGEVVEPPRYTLESDLPLDEGFRFLEENDAERVPVVEDGRLVGVLSRSVLQRRLAEDEPPPQDRNPGSVF